MHEKMQPHARTCAAGGSPSSPGSLGSPGLPSSPGKHRRSRWVAAFAAAAALALVTGSAWAYNYYSTNFNWYLDNPDAETFTLKTAGEMEAFSAIVNGEAPADPDGDGDTDFTGAISFEGKTVQLAGNVNLLGSLRDYEFTPIGKDADHAFAGTFEGNGYQISGLKLVAGEKDGAQLGTQGTQNIGLFGVVSAAGSLRNVNIGSTMSGESIVSVQSDKAAVSAVGSLVGLCQGTVENCTSAASITVAWDDGNEGNGRDPQVVMENIGGIAGICGQSLGTVPWSRNHAPVINTKIGYYCGGIVGGLFDYDESSIRVSDLPEIYGCYNTGQVTSWSSGAILGENNGYVHDCVALKDADPNNCLVYATSWAIVDNCVVACATADEAAALTAEQAEAFGGRVALNGGAALAVLNTQSMADGFDGNYYFIPTGTAKGFPVLDGEDYGRSSYDLSTLQLDVESDGKAPYTVAYDPVPAVTAKALIDGE